MLNTTSYDAQGTRIANALNDVAYEGCLSLPAFRYPIHSCNFQLTGRKLYGTCWVVPVTQTA
jgi:hypothetical protein